METSPDTVPVANPIINRSQVKKFALKLCKSTGRRFTRVSDEFLNEIESTLREAIAAKVHRHPSRGVTLKGTL